MKKMLFIFLLFFNGMTAQAERILSDEYYIEGQNPENFPFKLENDFITTQFNEWSINRPERVLNRVVEMRDVEKYRELKPIRYLLFNHFTFSVDLWHLAELNIFIDDKEINYSIISSIECNSLFEYYLKDGDTYQNYASVYKSGYFIVDLGSFYSINQLKIDFYTNDMGLEPKSFDLFISDHENVDDYYFYKQIMIYFISNPDVWEMNRYRIVPDSTWVFENDHRYTDYTYGVNEQEPSFYHEVYVGREYRYYDVLYRYYTNIEEVPTEDEVPLVEEKRSTPLIETLPEIKKITVSAPSLEELEVRQPETKKEDKEEQKNKLERITKEEPKKDGTTWFIILSVFLLFGVLFFIYRCKKCRMH